MLIIVIIKKRKIIILNLANKFIVKCISIQCTLKNEMEIPSSV